MDTYLSRHSSVALTFLSFTGQIRYSNQPKWLAVISAVIGIISPSVKVFAITPFAYFPPASFSRSPW